MKISFNPSNSNKNILDLIKNNKDIIFDLKGHSIFARGVEFKGTDTNTWRDIKINNVSIGSHTLDLRNGSNTTLTNTNGVVTINSTWRPVVDNLTSDSTTSSLSAKQGKVLKALIDGKSNSDHNHDGRYLRLSGQDTMQGNLYLHSHGTSYIGKGLGDKSGADFTEANIVIRSWWGISFKSYDDIVRTYIDTRTGNIGTKGVLNAVGAVIQGRVYNGGDDEGIIINPAPNGYAGLILGTHNGERSVFYLKKGNPFWRYNNGSTNLDIYHPKKSGTIALTSDIPNKDSWNYDDRYLKLTGGWMSGDINFGGDNKIHWGRNTDSASISFKNDGDGDANSYMSFVTSDNGNEYFRWSHSSDSTNTEWMALRSDGLRVRGTKVSLEGHSHNDLYYTESEVNSLLDAKLNRQNLSYGTWNPRGWNLAADYHYNGGDLSISENNGKMYVSVDGCFWQNEGQYRVLDTSDIGDIRNSVTLHQYLSATDVAWYPLVWGGNAHYNTSDSTGAVYKSYDKLSWQTSSQTLYATNIQTNNIKSLSIGGGIYWNSYVESASDGSDAASITLVRQGVAGGTTLVLSQMNDTNDTIQFKTNTAARLYHNSYPILTTQNTYVSNNKGNINGLEITQVNNSDKVDNRHAISTTPNTGIIYKAAIYTSSSLTSYWVRLASISSIVQNEEFVATIHVQSGHSNPGRSAILLVYLRGNASSFMSKSFKICCNSNYDPNRFRLYYKDSDKTSEIWYHTTGQWDGIITTVISQSSEGSLYERLTLYSGSITAVQTPSVSTYLSAQVSTITDNISGNASTATKLQTPRTIWGQSFDGTGNVSGFMKTVRGLIYGDSLNEDWSDGNNTHPWYGIDYRHCVDSTETGKSYTSISSYFGLYFKTGDSSFIFDGGNVGMGTTSPAYKLHVAGDIYTTTGFKKNGSSDSYVLLGGGGHKAISDFASSSHSHNYAANENYGGFTKSGRLPISGFYQSKESENGGNAPWTGWMHLINCQHSNTNNNYALQIAASFFDNNTFKIRVTNGSVNNSWRNIIHSGNISSQSVNYANSAGNADMVDGYHANGLLTALSNSNNGISITVGGTTKSISNINVNYAASAGNANTLDGYHANGGNDRPYGHIPTIESDGVMEVGRYIDFHNDNNGKHDFSTRLQSTGNYGNVVNLPSASGTLALINDVNNYYWANVKISASSSATTSPTVHTLTATRVCAGHNPGIDNSISCSNWFRSSGNTGWYNTTYQGGWYMSDTSWIRAHNGVGIYTSGQICSSSSIRMSNIFLEHTDEINNSANGGIHLNYRNSGNVSLCQGGGSVGIGTTTPSYKLDVNGQMRASGFHHASVNSDNHMLLAGGGYKTLKDFIFLNKSYNYTDKEHYNLTFHKLSGICNNLVWVDGHVKGSITKNFAIDPAVFPYRYDGDPNLNTIYLMTGNNYITINAIGMVTINNATDHKQRVGFFYTGRA